MIKYVAYGWSGERSLTAVRDQVWAALSAARQTGWDGLLAEQRAYLDIFWDRADVEIDGDVEIQQAGAVRPVPCDSGRNARGEKQRAIQRRRA